MLADALVPLLLAADLSVGASPGRLLLGSESQAVVSVSGPSDLSDVVVTVNHGSTAHLQRMAPGQFTADYLAPGQTFPRVAIVAVTGTTKGARVHGFTLLPLWGAATAEVKTTPRARVEVKIGDQTYGPIQADENGVGTFKVVVPPGVKQGFQGKKVLDLGLPQVALTHLVVDRPSVPGDQPRTLTARLYAVTEDGKPRSGLALKTRATAGVVGVPREEAKGVYAMAWTLPELPPQDAELTVWDATGSATAAVKIRAGPTVSLTVKADPAVVVAGTRPSVKVFVRGADARGNPTDVPPRLDTSFGFLGKVEPDGLGGFVAELAIPRAFGGARAAVITAHADGAEGRAAVTLRPGPVAAVTVVPRQLTGAGDVKVTPVDAFENPAEGAVTATAPLGALEPIAGGYHFEPPRTLSAASTELSFTAGGVSAEVPVALAPTPARLTAGLKAGFASNFGNANGFSAALELDAWLGAHVGVGVEAGYLFVPRDAVLADGPLAGRRVMLRVNAAPLIANVSLRGTLGGLPVEATLGGGAAVAASWLKAEGLPAVNETSVMPLLQAAVSAGLGRGFGRLKPFAEVGARWMGDGGGTALTGSLFAVNIFIGCRFDAL